MARLLELKEAAKRLGVHYETARDFVASGQLRAVRLGGRRTIQVREEDLEAFIEASLIGPEVGPKPHRITLESTVSHRPKKSLKPAPSDWRERFRAK